MIFCLFGEAPSIAGQILIAGKSTLGQMAASRQLVKQLSRYSVSVGALAALGTLLVTPLAPMLFSLKNGPPGSPEFLLRSVLSKTMIAAAMCQPICALTIAAE